MSISSEVWETPLRFLGTDDLGRVEEDLAETSPDLKRGLRQLFACLQDGLTDLSKLQRLQLQTSDIICLGQKLSTMKCLQGTVKMLKCLTMAKRQRKRSLARGSTAIHVGEEVLELQVEWFDTSVFLRLTSLKLVGKDEFIKSLLRGFLSVIIVETSQRQRGSDHGSGSVAALHLDRLGCDDLYKQRAEMFAR
eukprot:Skav222612  [mRNA]  locus=scaffold1190:43734:45180:+ [translate_table: standard]